MELPEETRRLFPGYAEADLGASPLLIGRLLEDGDSHDLAWLCRTVPEAELALWLEARGGRQLSVRSRAFWEVVLGREAGPVAESGSALWPL
ncbi:MAG: hypothetical protein ABUT39_18290 [Acidobacteriota bacterium]